MLSCACGATARGTTAALPSPGVPSPWRCANSWELSSATGHTQSDICQMDGGTFCVDWWRGFHCLRLVDDELKQGWASPPILCRVDRDTPLDPLDQDTRTMIQRGTARARAKSFPASAACPAAFAAGAGALGVPVFRVLSIVQPLLDSRGRSAVCHLSLGHLEASPDHVDAMRPCFSCPLLARMVGYRKPCLAWSVCHGAACLAFQPF